MDTSLDFQLKKKIVLLCPPPPIEILVPSLLLISIFIGLNFENEIIGLCVLYVLNMNVIYYLDVIYYLINKLIFYV